MIIIKLIFIIVLQILFFGNLKADTIITNFNNIYDISKKKPKKLSLNLHNEEVIIKGYYRPGEILLQKKNNNGKNGYHVIKPFAFVRQPNPSVGWPSIYALDVIMVNTGWIPLSMKNKHKFRKLIYDDPLFEEPIIIRGIAKVKTKVLKDNKNNPKKDIWFYPDIKMMRKYFDDLPMKKTNIPPTGQNVLPIYIELIDKKKTNEHPIPLHVVSKLKPLNKIIKFKSLTVGGVFWQLLTPGYKEKNSKESSILIPRFSVCAIRYHPGTSKTERYQIKVLVNNKWYLLWVDQIKGHSPFETYAYTSYGSEEKPDQYWQYTTKVILKEAQKVIKEMRNKTENEIEESYGY